MTNRIAILILAIGLVAVGCSGSLEGDSVVVDFRDSECQNGSIIEIDGDFYNPAGGLPSDWEGLTQLDVEITNHSGDRITVEDENGRVAEFKNTHGEVTTECLNW